ncbi:MAG TPA: glyoxylate/hydroxypyruvate reductase A [Xanthobacteraceae bacterium]|jgi:glyoxylate/hydroxypyruvate reductase A|nr:glyoxylate/hydroxypyruvate reductase A [Xanthobacteraceae bacterium]
MSALLLAITGWDPGPWEQRFRAAAPGRDIRLWPDRVGDPADIAYAAAWLPPPGAFALFPNLRAIFSLGAGVDALLRDGALPQVPIVRVVDPSLMRRMTEYVTLHVLMHHRRQRLYDAQQRQRLWHEHPQPIAQEVHVGIMGLGVLGRDAAEVLVRLGFQVAGWSRTPRVLPGLACFHGAAGLDPFLARTEILVCLLPHTPDTDGILNLALLRKLKRDGALGGAFLINAGRGRLQVDADIIRALDEGALAAATLDVFPTEPLPTTSPLWTHPNVTITPHNSAASVPEEVVDYVVKQIERLEAGYAPENVIDRASGY